MMSLEDLKGKIVNAADVDSAAETKNLSQKIYEFTRNQIEQIVVSDTDSTMVCGIIQVNNHKETVQLGSYESIQWLRALYFNQDHDFHSDDVFKNVLSMLVAQAQQEDAPKVTIFDLS